MIVIDLIVNDFFLMQSIDVVFEIDRLSFVGDGWSIDCIIRIDNEKMIVLVCFTTASISTGAQRFTGKSIGRQRPTAFFGHFPTYGLCEWRRTTNIHTTHELTFDGKSITVVRSNNRTGDAFWWIKQSIAFVAGKAAQLHWKATEFVEQTRLRCHRERDILPAGQDVIVMSASQKKHSLVSDEIEQRTQFQWCSFHRLKVIQNSDSAHVPSL